MAFLLTDGPTDAYRDARDGAVPRPHRGGRRALRDRKEWGPRTARQVGMPTAGTCAGGAGPWGGRAPQERVQGGEGGAQGRGGRARGPGEGGRKDQGRRAAAKLPLQSGRNPLIIQPDPRLPQTAAAPARLGRGLAKAAAHAVRPGAPVRPAAATGASEQGTEAQSMRPCLHL